MNLALAKYNKGDEEIFEDIGLSLVVVRDHLDLLAKLMHKFNSTKYFNGSTIGQLNTLNGAAEFVQQAKFPDWNKRDDIKSALKVGLILLLDEFGYPPVERDEVYVEIFEQAENFMKNRFVGRQFANQLMLHGAETLLVVSDKEKRVENACR